MSVSNQGKQVRILGELPCLLKIQSAKVPKIMDLTKKSCEEGIEG
jgi:hypothetical protein